MKPSDTYMRRQHRTPFVQRTACRHSVQSHFLNQCWNIVNWTLRTNFRGIWNEIQIFLFQKMHLKMSSAKSRLFYLGLNVMLSEYPMDSFGLTDLALWRRQPGWCLNVECQWCEGWILQWASNKIRKIVGCACAGNAGNITRHRLQTKPPVSDPGMHHGTCVTHVLWCMSGSQTRGGWENVPGIAGACATRNVTYLIRGP